MLGTFNSANKFKYHVKKVGRLKSSLLASNNQKGYKHGRNPLIWALGSSQFAPSPTLKHDTIAACTLISVTTYGMTYIHLVTFHTEKKVNKRHEFVVRQIMQASRYLRTYLLTPR